MNSFLQTIKIDTREKEEGLPPHLQRMLKTAKKYEVTFHPQILENNLKDEMPIWFHLGLAGVKNIIINSKVAICQREVHKILTMGDMRYLAELADTRKNPRHKTRKNCACKKFKWAREKGCKNPHKCSLAAQNFLSKLGQRWNLDMPNEKRDLTEREKELREGEGIQVFNPDMMMQESLREGFQLFTEETAADNQEHMDYSRLPFENEPAVVVFTDGSCQKN